MAQTPAPGGGLLRPSGRWAGSVKDRRRRHVCARRASLTGSARRMHPPGEVARVRAARPLGCPSSGRAHTTWLLVLEDLT